ncbi:polyprotein 2 [Red clover nepovirus A]|uniref:Polyprotein 2 n=1 Tax=Red clover nepovirus A TaxID=2058094 RepID=A0A2K8ZCQ0_9SECO|nr:polyprotein 2 [Red clover nepovirus A]AUD08128.1 polyprotein 2 [Red clover nepovirus A]
MGFEELFSSDLGHSAQLKATLCGGLASFLRKTITTVQAAGPEIRKIAYSALWGEIDSVKELTPLTERMLADQLKADLLCTRVRTQKCNPVTTSRFCSCGGVQKEPSMALVDVIVDVDICPPGRNLCRNGTHCTRHGGLGQFSERRIIPIEEPVCPHCSGTGILPRSAPYEYLQKNYELQTKTFARPSSPLHEWVLEEGSASRFIRRCQEWKWKSRDCLGLEDENPVDVSTWMAAAQILFDNTDARVYYPGTNYMVLNGGSKGYDDWCRLPPSKEMCDRLFDWWHRKNTPGYTTPERTLVDFIKPRMGKCYLPIEKEKHILPYEWSGRVPCGDFTVFGQCVDGLMSSMEEFLDVFYDCAAQFDGYLEFYLDASERPSHIEGKLGGVQVLFKTPAVCSPAKLLPEIGESDFDALESDVHDSHIPALFRDNGLSALYSNLVLNAAKVQPVLRAHPDREEIEDQKDHLENKQGGEVFSTPSFIRMLKAKKKEVRGKEFKNGSEGRLVRSADLELSKNDVFIANTLMESLRAKNIVRTFMGNDPRLSKTCVDLTNKAEIVKYPSRELTSTAEGVLTAQVFTVLNRPQYQELNKLAERGWKEAKSVCLNLHIRSYLPVHSPVYAFCVIMWGHSSNADLASLCGAYCYLGDQEASVLELPLLCSHIGNSVDDFQAYERSLVLSTCFYGLSGIKAGQQMFGITAVEFTEYLPSSFGGITHERDSWHALLRKHQGKEKSRFISGFNVVDVLEAGKERGMKFPDFKLEPVDLTQPIVRNFGEEKQPLLNKSSSLKVGTFERFRAGNISIGRQLDNRVDAIEYELGRASTSRVGDLRSEIDGVERRLNTFNLKSLGDFAFSARIKYPKAVSVGTVLSKIDLFASITGTNSRVCAEWLEMGYIDRNLRFISHLSAGPFLGAAVWFVFDAFGHMPTNVSTTIELESVRHLCPHVQILKDSTTDTWVLDFHRSCGQSLSFSGTGFLKPTLWVISASSAQLECSADVTFVLEAYATGDRMVKGLATDSVLTYPIGPESLSDLDMVLSPTQLALGTHAATALPLTLAEKSVTTSGIETYSYAMGILSHFLGVGGTVRFSVHSTSSKFVSCKLRIIIWGTTPTIAQTGQMPHCDIIEGGSGELKIQSPFYSTANFGSEGAQFWVIPLSSPMAPAKVESKFEFYIRIHGIDSQPDLCKQINYKQRFGWFMVKPEGTDREFQMFVPSRVSNLVIKGVDCTNFVNAFAIMCATTGMHWGKCIVHFTWAWKHDIEASKMKGNLSFGTGMGTKDVHHGETRIFSIYDNSYSIPFEFGSFAGPVTSGGKPFEAENWIKIHTTSWNWIHSIMASIEVLPGFKFYGRSAGPMLKPPESSDEAVVTESSQKS